MTAQVGKPKKANKVNKEQALKLKMENNLTYREIGQMQGVSAVAVFKSIRHLLPTEETKVFSNHKAEIFEEIQRRYIANVNDDVIQKRLRETGMTDVGILQDKIRTMRGEATSFQVNVIADLEAIRELKSQSTPIEGIELDKKDTK